MIRKCHKVNPGHHEAEAQNNSNLHNSKKTLKVKQPALSSSTRLKRDSTTFYGRGHREHSGSVVECLTRDRGAVGMSLTSVTVLCPRARHINPSLVLVQPRKTRPCITERLLMGRKESNQTNKYGRGRGIQLLVSPLTQQIKSIYIIRLPIAFIFVQVWDDSFLIDSKHISIITLLTQERSGRVLDLRPRVRASPASLRCGPWARHIYPSLVLVQPRKTRPCLTERLLMGHKE